MTLGLITRRGRPTPSSPPMGKPPAHKNLLELASAKSAGVPPLGIKPVIPALKMGALNLGTKKPEIPKMTLPLS